ncbi:Multidrug resistance protein (Efflux pump/antiporter) [Nitrospira lenta]|uniref:Multidrug resistance protein (Efflux pump/antiporter) n=1 Tax=Nitrospira lenta TaxID=1436998 RepID=A0A330LCD4_9BACT|nr:Multidrug resistance protein (Efflux pump/antiporter) [Nitrospira lenta]
MDHQNPSNSTIPASIRLQPSRITLVLAAVASCLVLLSFTSQFLRYGLGHDYLYGLLPITEELFHVDREQNISTLFSVTLLLCSGSLLVLIALMKRQRQDPDVSKWMILAGGFFYLATDEGWSLHERLIEPVRGLLGHGDLGIFYFAWIIPAMAGVALLGVLFLGFLFRLPSSTRRSFIIAGALYLGGAIGIEMLGGRYAELHGLKNLTYQLFAHLEESLEMAGIILFIHTLLHYLAEQYPEIRLLTHQ